MIGHGLLRFKKNSGAEYLKFMDQVPNDGLIRYRGFLNANHVLLTGPHAFADVLVKRPYDFEKPKGGRDFLRRALGDGLVVVEGDVHRFQRKRLLPNFSFRNIKELYPTIWSKALRMTDAIQKDALDRPAADGIVEINFWSTKVTLDIIGIAGLGRDFGTLTNSDDLLAQLYDQIMEPTFGKMIVFALTSFNLSGLAKFVPGKVDARLEKATDRLRETCSQFIRDKRETDKRSEARSSDILSKLMETNEFSDRELIDQLLTFIAAGFV